MKFYIVLALGFFVVSLNQSFAASQNFICRNVDTFTGGTTGGMWKVTLPSSKNYVSFVYTNIRSYEVDNRQFPAQPVIMLPRVSTNFGHLRFEKEVIYGGISSVFSFNLMGTEILNDNIQATDGVLTNWDFTTGQKSAYLCVNH